MVEFNKNSGIKKVMKGKLLAPAGNIEVAIRAVEAGCDAVYLGLDEFSARKSAKNFSIEDLRVLRAYTIPKGVEIYVALNTIITSEEFIRFQKLVEILDSLRVDAVIVQDFGALHYLKKRKPCFEIHASTQMAIHNAEGARALSRLGVSQVVLARELSFVEIKKIIQAVPEIKFEVFIHGSMCYSISGNCLASGILLERSGNRGACAQICRNYYGDKDFFPLSCKDLALEDSILKLESIGISTFKIEGRMKGSDYVASSVHLYRKILERKEFKEERDENRMSFLRESSKGYFEFKGDITGVSPFHKGIPLGSYRHGSIKLLRGISLYDGISFSGGGDQVIQIVKRGQVVNEAVKGDRVSLKLKRNKSIEGLDLFRNSSGTNSRDTKRVPKELFRVPLALSFKILEYSIELSVEDFARSYELSVEEAKKEELSLEDLRVFFNQSKSDFFEVSDLELHNRSQVKRIFFPLSKLKSIRKSFYRDYHQHLFESVYDQRPVVDIPKGEEVRTRLNPGSGRIPFFQAGDTLGKYIPLHPFVTDANSYYQALKKVVSKDSVIGINNLFHFEVLKKLKKDGVDCSFFLDYLFYVANPWTLSFVFEEFGEPCFWYDWIERQDGRCMGIMVKDREELPLMISRAGIPAKHRLRNRQFDLEVLAEGELTYIFKKVNT